MQITKTHKIILSIVAVVVLLGIYIAFDRKSKRTETKTDDSIATTTTQSGTTSSGMYDIEGTGNYKVEQVYGNEGAGVPQPVPDLNRKVTVSAGAYVTPEAKTIATAKILELQASLKKNTADIKAWINLGIYQKMAGDYEGAILSWKYAIRLSPTDYVPPANLGNLYAYFVKNNTQAEVYYKEAISKGPTQAYLYVQLAEAYRDVFKDLTKARATVDAGLVKIPNDANLLQLKASLNQ